MWLLPSPVHFFLLQFVLLLVLLLPSCLTKKKEKKERKERKPSSRGHTPAGPSPCRKPPKKSKKSTTGTTISTQASITKKSSSGQNRSPKIPYKMKPPKQPAPKPTKSKAKSKMEPPKSNLERSPPKFMHAPSNTSLARQAESPMAHFDPGPLVKRLGLNVDQIIAVMTMSPERRDDWWEYVNLDLEEEYKRREKEWKEHDCVKNKKKPRRPKEKEEKDGGPAYCEGCYYYAHLKEEVRRMLEDFGDYPRLYVKPEDKKTIEKINAIADKMGGSRQEVDVDRATLEGRQQNIRLRKRKRIAEKQKIERERLKVEEEKKKKEETKQTEKKKEGTKQTAAGGGGGGQYESLIDAVGVKKRGGGQEKEGKKKPEAHYESLFNEPTVLMADTQESYENPFDNQ